MGVATRPLTKTVYEITNLAAGATNTHSISGDIVGEATHAFGCLEILVEVTAGVANFDLIFYSATHTVNIWTKTGLKFSRYLYNKNTSMEVAHDYSIKVKNNDDEQASYKVTYSCVKY